MIKQCRKLNLTFKISWIKQVGSMHFLNHLQDLFDTLPKPQTNLRLYSQCQSLRRRIPQNASVTCELPSFGIGIFSYDSGIVFENKTSLVDIPETVKSINGTLLSCVRGFQSESTDANFIIAPNATVSLQKPTIDFLIEFLPDRMSKILLALEVLVILLGLLPSYQGRGQALDTRLGLFRKLACGGLSGQPDKSVGRPYGA